MNERAQAIGITASRFAPPGEVGRRQAITGADAIRLGAHMLNDAPAVREGCRYITLEHAPAAAHDCAICCNHGSHRQVGDAASISRRRSRPEQRGRSPDQTYRERDNLRSRGP
jgi:hypothetical protein